MLHSKALFDVRTKSPTPPAVRFIQLLPTPMKMVIFELVELAGAAMRSRVFAGLSSLTLDVLCDV